MNGPQDLGVDRRSFLQRMGAITAAAATGGLALPTFARSVPPGPIPSAGDFFDQRARPELSGPGAGDPTGLSIREAGVLLREGAISARELAEAHLARIREWDGIYRAFNAVLPFEALAAADRADAAPPEGLLHGIPLVLKDNYYTEGVATTANSELFRDFIPSFDATAVARIRRAGGVILGKTQMGPLATTRALTSDGEITTVSAWAPHDPRVNPGGSSTGTATAVAARMAMGGTGTQTGGSITGPANAQGLTGIKPTMGRVSLYGVIPLSYTRDHPGPIARDAIDAALLLQVMAGPDTNDPRTLGLPPVPDYLAAVDTAGADAASGLRWPTRIGVPLGWADGSDDRGRMRQAFLGEIERAGASLVEIRYPDAWDGLTSSAFNNVRLVERSEPFLEHLRGDVRNFGVTLSSWINGLFLSGDEYLKGQRGKLALLRLVLDELFDRCDLLLQTSHLPFDMIGLPLAAFPIGFRETAGGALPEGVIVGGLPFGEERLLNLAATWQARSDWHRRRPADPEVTRGAGAGGGAGRGRLGLEEVALLSE